MENIEQENRFEQNCENKEGQLEFERIKKRVKRIEIVSFISLILLVILIGINIVSIGSQVEPTQNNVAIKELPPSLNSTEIKEIASDIQAAYNSGDSNKMYAMLGDYAQTLVTLEEMTETMSGLKLLGNLEKASYSYSEFLGNKEGADWFNLHYVAKYENGSGTLRITLRIVDDNWEVVGFHMNVEQLQNSN